MESNEREVICYKILSEIFLDNAYASMQLNSAFMNVAEEADRAYISNLVYGVLEKNVQLDYILNRLVSKRPKTSVGILIKIGLYHLRYMSTPAYAAINETVELTKRIGKGGLTAFVNAVLRKSISVTLPSEGEINNDEYLSINFSVPLWVSRKLIEQYGYEFTKAFLSCEPSKNTHIRFNSRLINKSEFEQKLSGFEFERSKLGYYVTHNMLKTLEKSIYTPQSLASMIAVNCYLPSDMTDPVVLDLCGAPGGKSIFLEELCPSAKIYCYDVHPHRVELIKKYAHRMRSNIVPMLGDASIILPEWVNRCDMVICDVPCSGLGVYKSKPDILFNKKPSDIDKIKKVQKGILDNAKNYVKVGGVLCYSTCTVFKEENEDNVYEFLESNPNFRLDKIGSETASENDGMIKLFPHINAGCDGFFVARLRRIK